MLKHFLIIGVIGIFAGLIHGGLSERGFNMPKKASTKAPPQITLPITPAETEVEIEPQPTPVPQETQSSETSSADEFPVDLLYDYWANDLAVLVDARSEDEFAESHIPMAVHLPLEGFDNGLPETILALPTDYYLIVYCGGGDCHASHSVGSLLTEYGYTNVLVFEKGFAEWADAGYPVESGN